MQCKARSRRNQARCRNHALKGLEVCRMHGGKTPRGPASVHWKTGRWSKFLPSRLLAHYRAARLDPELLSLREEVAVVDARIIDILRRVDTGESGALWRDVHAAMTLFEQRQARHDVKGMTEAFTRLQHLISRGVADDAAWGEIGTLIDQRRKLVESEQRRVTLAAEVLTREQALAFMGQIVDIVTRHVRDKQVLHAMLLDMQALGHASNGHQEQE
jgi:hypothetical protein